MLHALLILEQQETPVIACTGSLVIRMRREGGKNPSQLKHNGIISSLMSRQVLRSDEKLAGVNVTKKGLQLDTVGTTV